MSILIAMWGVLTAALVLLLIYRSTLTIHEEDQLFLDQAEAHMEKEQAENLARLDRTRIPMRLLAAASGLLLVLMAVLSVYRGWNQ